MAVRVRPALKIAGGQRSDPASKMKKSFIWRRRRAQSVVQAQNPKHETLASSNPHWHPRADDSGPRAQNFRRGVRTDIPLLPKRHVAFCEPSADFPGCFAGIDI